MVSGLVEEQDIGLEEHSASKGELHLPTTGKGANGVSLALIGETDGGEGLDDLLLGDDDTLVGENELKDRGILLGTINVVLDVEGTDLVGGRETLDLAVGDGAHEGRLSGTVLTAQTVAVATLETESGGVEKDLGTVGKRELAVAQILALLLVLKSLTLVKVLSGGTNNPLASDSDGVGGCSRERKVRRNEVPLGNVEVVAVGKVGSQRRGVDDSDVGNGRISTELLVDSSNGCGHVGGVGDLDGREVGAIAASGNLADLTEGVDGTVDDGTSLGITGSGLDLEQTREELGQEGTDGNLGVDELGHVVDDADNGLMTQHKGWTRRRLTPRPCAWLP